VCRRRTHETKQSGRERPPFRSSKAALRPSQGVAHAQGVDVIYRRGVSRLAAETATTSRRKVATDRVRFS
jgi:hypothetical protein